MNQNVWALTFIINHGIWHHKVIGVEYLCFRKMEAVCDFEVKGFISFWIAVLFRSVKNRLDQSLRFPAHVTKIKQDAMFVKGISFSPKLS